MYTMTLLLYFAIHMTMHHIVYYIQCSLYSLHVQWCLMYQKVVIVDYSYESIHTRSKVSDHLENGCR